MKSGRVLFRTTSLPVNSYIISKGNYQRYDGRIPVRNNQYVFLPDYFQLG